MFIAIIKLLSSFLKKAVIYFKNNKKCSFPLYKFVKPYSYKVVIHTAWYMWIANNNNNIY